MEGQRSGGPARIRVVNLPDYQPAAPVAAKSTPDPVSYGSSDLSVVKQYASASHDIDVKVYGRTSDSIQYRRNVNGVIEKTYVYFSNDGPQINSGREEMQDNPTGRATYTAQLT